MKAVAAYSVAGKPWRSRIGGACSTKSTVPSSKVMTTGSPPVPVPPPSTGPASRSSASPRNSAARGGQDLRLCREEVDRQVELHADPLRGGR